MNLDGFRQGWVRPFPRVPASLSEMIVAQESVRLLDVLFVGAKERREVLAGVGDQMGIFRF
jgi:hypothetical protein